MRCSPDVSSLLKPLPSEMYLGEAAGITIDVAACFLSEFWLFLLL